MKIHEFYAKYAAMPLDERLRVINFNKFGTMTFEKLYWKVYKLDKKIRPLSIKIDDLIDIFEWSQLDK